MLLHTANLIRNALTALTLLSRPPSCLHAARHLRRIPAAHRRALVQRVDDELLPKVALVGRPNVGKSALFNRLLRRRVALVYDTPTSHVTRDYQEGRGTLGDLVFRLADTSGLEPRTANSGGTIQGRATLLTAKLLRQSHVTIMVIDAKDGVMPADEELADWLRQQVPGEQVLLVANKAEGKRAREEMPQTVYDCYRLGFGEPIALSATTGDGLTDLYVALQPHIDRVSEQLAALAPTGAGAAPTEETFASAEGTTGAAAEAEAEGEQDGKEEGEEPERLRPRRRPALFDPAAVSSGTDPGVVTTSASALEEGGTDEGEGGEAAAGPGPGSLGVLKLAIMGAPNAGKSTLLNRLLGEERSLTGPEPGLTRDSVRAAWMYGSQQVELFDTAGWVGRGLTGRHDDVGGDLAAMARAASLRSLAQVHVVLLVVDAERALRNEKVLHRRDVALAHMVLREGKALVIVANKADALNRHQRETYVRALRRQLSERFLDAGPVPVRLVSALEGTGVEELMPEVVGVYEAWNKSVSTARLNKFVRKLAVRMVGSGMEASVARVKFLAQTKARPPTFAAFLSGTRQRPVERSFVTFLEHQIRDVMGFPGVPLRVHIRYREPLKERLKRLRSGAGKARRATAGGSPAEPSADPDVTRGRKVATATTTTATATSTDSGTGSIMALARRRAAELRGDGGDEDAGLLLRPRGPGRSSSSRRGGDGGGGEGAAEVAQGGVQDGDELQGGLTRDVSPPGSSRSGGVGGSGGGEEDEEGAQGDGRGREGSAMGRRVRPSVAARRLSLRVRRLRDEPVADLWEPPEEGGASEQGRGPRPGQGPPAGSAPADGVQQEAASLERPSVFTAAAASSSGGSAAPGPAPGSNLTLHLNLGDPRVGESSQEGGKGGPEVRHRSADREVAIDGAAAGGLGGLARTGGRRGGEGLEELRLTPHAEGPISVAHPDADMGAGAGAVGGVMAGPGRRPSGSVSSASSPSSSARPAKAGCKAAGGGGEPSAGGLSQSALMRTMLFSRKPSAPLLPAKLPGPGKSKVKSRRGSGAAP